VTIEQAALDLLTKGACSVPFLGGELVKRQLIGKEHSIGQAYRIARETLDALAAAGKAKKHCDGYCYTIPDSITVEKTKDPT
jgi:hypothetical protein